MLIILFYTHMLNNTLTTSMVYATVYLPGGSAVRVDNLVEVFMDSVEQPEEEFLGVVLGITLELQGALRHHILQPPSEGTH